MLGSSRRRQFRVRVSKHLDLERMRLTVWTSTETSCHHNAETLAIKLPQGCKIRRFNYQKGRMQLTEMSRDGRRERAWEAAERRQELTHDKEHRAGRSSLRRMSWINR